MARELELLRRAPGADPGGRVEPQGLLHRQVQLGHLAEQLGGARAAFDAAALGGEALGPLRASG